MEGLLVRALRVMLKTEALFDLQVWAERKACRSLRGENAMAVLVEGVVQADFSERRL
jgi:hypothetical protein